MNGLVHFYSDQRLGDLDDSLDLMLGSGSEIAMNHATLGRLMMGTLLATVLLCACKSNPTGAGSGTAADDSAGATGQTGSAGESATEMGNDPFVGHWAIEGSSVTAAFNSSGPRPNGPRRGQHLPRDIRNQ